MRGISCFVHILRDRSKLLRLKLTKLFPNINFSGEKDSGKVLIIIIILFLIIVIIIFGITATFLELFKEGITNKKLFFWQWDALPLDLQVQFLIHYATAARPDRMHAKIAI